jgi:hypothetical protein
MRYSAKLSTLEFLNIRWSLNFYTLYFWIVLSLLRLPSGIDTCGQPGSSFFVNRSSSRPDYINCREDVESAEQIAIILEFCPCCVA